MYKIYKDKANNWQLTKLECLQEFSDLHGLRKFLNETYVETIERLYVTNDIGNVVYLKIWDTSIGDWRTRDLLNKETKLYKLLKNEI